MPNPETATVLSGLGPALQSSAQLGHSSDGSALGA